MDNTGEIFLPITSDLTHLAETLAAMANSEGGTLLLELGKYTFDDAIDRVREASLRVDPHLILPLPISIDSGLIAVIIPRGLSHVFALEGRYLARQDGMNRPLTPRELRRLLLERGELCFEEEVVQGVTLDDLNERAIENYVARLMAGSYSAEALLAHRNCIVKYNDEWVPTNAGLLLFGKEPQHFIRGAFITAARFAGTEMGDTFTRQEIIGSLPEQIFQAEAFLLDNLRRDVQLGASMERTELYEYPMEAARELVVNAVSHRDYSIYGDGIRMFLFGDRLEVTSPGGLPGPVTVDNIVEERYSRNSIIVQVLSDMGFIERLGYGVDRVIALMRERGLPQPEFTETGGGFRVRLFNTQRHDVTVTPNDGSYMGYSLTSRQESALQYLTLGGNRRITNKDLQELFPDVHPETIRRDLADLVHKGILVKMGEKRGSYYILHHSHKR